MATVRTLGASHLASEGWETQRKSNFEVTIPGVGDSDRVLALSVLSCSLPSESNEVISLQYGNTVVKVAGTYSVEGGTLTVRDIIQKDTEAMLDAWRKQVFNKDNKAIGFAARYKKQGRVVQYAPDGSYERVWKLKGLWPQAVNYGDMSNSDGAPKEISITFQYDEAILDR